LVPAEVVREGARVWLRKRCARHGVSSFLLSENGDEYVRLDRAYHRMFPPDGPPAASLDTYAFLTNRCNQLCGYCATEANRYPYFDEFRDGDFAEVLAAHAGPKVSLIGGEPLLHPRLGEFAAAATAARKTLVVYTNGLELADAARVRLLARAGRRVEVRMTLEGFTPTDYRHLRTSRVRERKLRALENLAAARVPTVLGHTLGPEEQTGADPSTIAALVAYAMAHQDFIRGLTFQGVVALGGAHDRAPHEVLSVDTVMDRVVQALPVRLARHEVYVTQKLAYLMAHVFDLPLCAYVQAVLLFRAGDRWVGLDHFFDCERLDARLDARVERWDPGRPLLVAALAQDLLACVRPAAAGALARLVPRLLEFFVRRLEFSRIPRGVLPIASITVCDRHNFDAQVARRCEKTVHARSGAELRHELCSHMVMRQLRERVASRPDAACRG
jgi:hypothetical protein